MNLFISKLKLTALILFKFLSGSHIIQVLFVILNLLIRYQGIPNKTRGKTLYNYILHWIKKTNRHLEPVPVLVLIEKWFIYREVIEALGDAIMTYQKRTPS